MEQTLANLLREEMTLRRLSTRDVARESGIAHTTIARILHGRSVNINTLNNVAKYLNARSSSFLVSGNNEDDLLSVIAALVEQEPALEDVFKKAAIKVINGETSPEVLREVVRYATWRINDVSGTAKDGSENNSNDANKVPGISDTMPGS